PNPASQDLQYMNISSLDGPTLMEWLGDKTKIVVGESFDSEVTSRSAGSTPQRLTQIGADYQLIPSVSATIVMLNLGAALYLDGLEKGFIYTIEVADRSVEVLSPAIGLIQIGEGLFGRQIGTLTSVASSMLRNLTYAH